MLRMPLLNGWSLNKAVTRLRLAGEIERGGPAETIGLAGVDVDGGDRQLPALVEHATHVVEHGGEPRRTRDRALEQQVVGLLVIVVRRQADPALGEGHVNAGVELLRRLPLEVGIGQVGRRAAGIVAVVRAAEKPLKRESR